ncbi:hypothetical protein KNU39_gp81 [Gordonia phage Mutzi]|uniref:Uncharacterized protein n=2 Tax=Wizardvirus TaxID=2169658 RepID=A0A411AXU7_9CAUD|nr:hypothetical protein KNU39_gp81 [Gordonia phage Mutzi]QAX92890.1 hypothetical protein SEA_MUTZI_81 [Gordonia phage Mutzi]QWY84767.1 hypothetical protein SEA_YUNGMONEY_81 [Gordonia phage YungMoney]WNO27948.1 hypothetical protein SEA_HALO3_81 [Gordonia phage Halo3]
MQRVTIGRYRDDEAQATRIHCDEQGNEVSREPFKAYAGWIEGVRDDGTTWIIYLDENGSPQTFWGERDDTGAIIGDPILLQ